VGIGMTAVRTLDVTGTFGATEAATFGSTLGVAGTLTATAAVALSPANANVVISPTGTGLVTINPATAGAIDNMSIGVTTPAAGKFTTLQATGNITNATTGNTIGTMAWVAMTGSYSNSWVDFSAGWAAGRYMKDPFGFVHIEGMVKNGTAAATIFTLPAGYRPSLQLYLPTISNDVTAIISISSAGALLVSGGSNAYAVIACSFYAG
jgi:hypothetical protein